MGRPTTPARVLLALLLTTAVAAAQHPGPPRLPGAIAADEATLLVNGYAFLAQGQMGGAFDAATEARRRFPRSFASLTFAVEVEIARGGAKAGLDLYESWLGARPLEEPGLVRRVATASLQEFASQTQDGLARDAALWALADDGDQEAYARIFEPTQTGDTGAIRRLAERGDQRAVNALLPSFETPMPNLVATIISLGESRSPLVVEPLTRKLTHPDPGIRGTAAQALAKAGGAAMIPRLRPLLDDSTAFVRASAAGALFGLGDYSGMVILQELMDSPVPRGRLRAAELMASRPDAAWLRLVQGLLEMPDTGVPGDAAQTRLGAARLLIAHNAAAARNTLDELATDANPAIRHEATRILAGDVTVPLSTLRQLLRHEDWLTRVYAATSITRVTRVG